MMATVRGRRERGTVVRGGHHGGQVVRNPITKEITPSWDWTEDSNGHYLLVDLPDFKKDELKLQVDTSGILTISGQTFTRDNKCILNFKQTFTLPTDSDIEKISCNFDSDILNLSVPKRAVEKDDEMDNTTSDYHHGNKNVNDISDHVSGEDGITHHIDSDHVSGEDGITHHIDSDHESSDKSHKKENEEKKSHDDGDENEHEFGRKEPSEMVNSHGYNGENASEYSRKEEKNSHIDSFGKELLEKWERESGQLEKAVKMIKDNKGIVVTALLAFSLGVFVSRKFGGVGST